MFCNNCGAKIDDDALFCGECGQKIMRASESNAPSNTVSAEEIQAQQAYQRAQAVQNIEQTQKVHVMNTTTAQQTVKQANISQDVQKVKNANKALVITVISLAIVIFLAAAAATVYFVWGDEIFGNGTSDVIPAPNPNPNPDPEPETDEPEVNELDEKEINKILSAHTSETNYTIYVKNLSTGYEYGKNENMQLPASAMSYITILDSLSNYIVENNIDPDEEDIYFEYFPNGREKPDSEYDDGLYFTVRDYMANVATFGDNNRANALVDYIGGGSSSIGFRYINNYLSDNGYENCSINRKIFTDSDKIDKNASPNMVCAKDIANMFSNVIDNSIFGDKYEMLDYCSFKDGEYNRTGAGGALSGKYTVGNHNGANSVSTNEVAYITNGEQDLVICVLSKTDDGSTVDKETMRSQTIEELFAYVALDQLG